MHCRHSSAHIATVTMHIVPPCVEQHAWKMNQELPLLRVLLPRTTTPRPQTEFSGCPVVQKYDRDNCICELSLSGSNLLESLCSAKEHSSTACAAKFNCSGQPVLLLLSSICLWLPL